MFWSYKTIIYICKRQNIKNMGNRLNKERESTLQPKRINHATEEITALGFVITKTTSTYIQFVFKKQTVTFYPYSGWASGKGIKDGRGLENLLKQLK